MLSSTTCNSAHAKSGIALLITLAFVVLLAALVVAFLSRTTNHRLVANTATNETKADQLARGALDIVVGNLKQEISAGSPISSANILPQRSGTPTPGSLPIPNLVRISFQGEATGTAPIPPPAVSSRASRVNSTAPSLNGRSISGARWNSHYLVPRATTSTTLDSTPIATFNAPDWVLVTADGPQVLTPPATGAVGRYAFAIYDEGGLLDMNVAGFPYSPKFPASAAAPGVPTTDVGRKGIVALADLTGLPTSPTVITATTSTPGSWHSADSISDCVGWKNYATVQPTGAFNNFSFDPATVSPGTGSRFLGVFLSTTNGFLTASTTTTPGRRTDQVVVSRGELLELRSSLNFSQNVLQYLGTFSRESNHSTWSDSETRLSGRFALNRFDLFTNPTTNATAIKRYFGLVYVAASGGTPEHWQYFGAEGTGLQPSIHSLIGNGQDPDLSVLLRYAYSPSSPDSEIFSIMASLIDQRDTNGDTTWIEYANSDPAAAPLRAYGVDRTPSSEPGAPPPPAGGTTVLNRAFRNVGELGYAYRNGATTLDFRTAGSADAHLLDLFTFNTAPLRAGVVSLNTGNIAVITAILMGATTNETAATYASRTNAYQTAQNIVTEVNRQNAIGRTDITRLVGAAGTALGSSAEAKQTVARALAELSQTRTWNLMIDVIAQSGRYPANAGSLANFIVEGEKRYWLHVAIDRFTGEVIDQQLEAVFE
ncbi:MAG: hypothetical protein DME41_08480 [Verrucomicrobia bacterium]|nr:MAG: hypothetical protein DME41_08480 [Verrucomicrobiota bacterium]